MLNLSMAMVRIRRKKILIIKERKCENRNIILCDKGTYLLLEKKDLVNFEKTTNFFDREESERT